MSNDQVIALKNFIQRCRRFDWQWYWRDTAKPDGQVALLSAARAGGERFVRVYEHYRVKAQNPYCPAGLNDPFTSRQS